MTSPPLKSERSEIEDSPEAVLDFVLNQGWGDGLPVIPPTEERVRAMVEGSGLPADHLIGSVGPAKGEATIEKIAVNAVMAGCKPEYMPVLTAAMEAVCESQFNMDGVQSTTNPCGVGIVVNGPIRNALDINCSRNCMGPGWQANATIGRAMSLMWLNIGGAKPGEVDKASHGYPGKYTLCFGEDEEHTPWEPLHVERGFKAEESTVTVNSFNGTLNIIGATYTEIDSMLHVIAHDFSQMGSNNLHLGKGNPGLVLTAGHARWAHEAGMSKSDVKEFVYRNSGFPVEKLRPMIRRNRIDAVIQDGVVRQVRKPDDIMIVVAGGVEPYHAVLMPTFGDSWAVTKPIRVP